MLHPRYNDLNNEDTGGNIDGSPEGQNRAGGRRRLKRPGWGNGKATAVTFAREGAQVFCVDRNGAAAEETVKIIAGEGGKGGLHRRCIRAGDVEAMVAACLKAYGRIDVLDNNVGIAEMGSVVDVSEAEWDRVFAVNLKSAYLAMKHVIPVMVRQGGGSIINISSIASIRHPACPTSPTPPPRPR